MLMKHVPAWNGLPQVWYGTSVLVASCFEDAFFTFLSPEAFWGNLQMLQVKDFMGIS